MTTRVNAVYGLPRFSIINRLNWSGPDRMLDQGSVAEHAIAYVRQAASLPPLMKGRKSMQMWVAIWGSTAIVSMILGAIIAGVKRLDASAWAAWCFFLPPALIILILQSRNTGPRPERPSLDDDDNYRE